MLTQIFLTWITGVISFLSSFKTDGFISSGPAALSTFKFDNNFKIPFAFILMSGIVGYLHLRFFRNIFEKVLNFVNADLTQAQGKIQTGTVNLEEWLLSCFHLPKYFLFCYKVLRFPVSPVWHS